MLFESICFKIRFQRYLFSHPFSKVFVFTSVFKGICGTWIFEGMYLHMRFQRCVCACVFEGMYKAANLNSRNGKIFCDDVFELEEFVGQVSGLGDRRVVIVGCRLDAERIRVSAVLEAEAAISRKRKSIKNLSSRYLTRNDS